MSIWEFSVPSCEFWCTPKIVLKNKGLKCRGPQFSNCSLVPTNVHHCIIYIMTYIQEIIRKRKKKLYLHSLFASGISKTFLFLDANMQDLVLLPNILRNLLTKFYSKMNKNSVNSQVSSLTTSKEDANFLDVIWMLILKWGCWIPMNVLKEITV